MNSSAEYINQILEKRIGLGIIPGLERVRSVLSRFVNIHSPDFFVIQVAGTNGKGTVCSLLENYFMLCNVPCGMFTSPHIERVNERIKVNGKEINDDEFVELLKFIESIEENCTLTYFEVLTAAAIKYFVDKKIKIAILETGMGGRLDSCTAIDKDIAVITQIDMDHCHFLGDTVEKIFCEKIAIANNAKKVLMLPQPHNNLGGLYEKYLAKNSDTEQIAFIDYNRWQKTSNYPASFKKNFSLFYSVVKELDKSNLIVEHSQNVKKCAHIKVKGRIEKLKIENKRVIVDVSHNPAGIQNLVSHIEKYYPNEKFTIIFGALEDKDYYLMVDILLKIAKKMYIFSPLQAINADAKRKFADIDTNFGGLKKIECKKIYEITKDIVENNTLVCGSFKLAGDFYSVFKKNIDR